MDDLITFLRARLDEDEQIAESARERRDWDPKIDERPAGPSDGQWSAEGEEISGDGILIVGIEDWHTAEQAHHIARWHPSRVMAEVEAKRHLIARGGPFCTSGCDEPGSEPKNPETNWTTPLEHHCDCDAYTAAGVLALPYQDHPDYRSEWRPQ